MLNKSPGDKREYAQAYTDAMNKGVLRQKRLYPDHMYSDLK